MFFLPSIVDSSANDNHTEGPNTACLFSGSRCNKPSQGQVNFDIETRTDKQHFNNNHAEHKTQEMFVPPPRHQITSHYPSSESKIKQPFFKD
jgi:hypothetical protein